MTGSPPDPPTAREGVLPVEHAGLYYRDIGRGQPVVVLHGGPDFNHYYLLPELDRLADPFRLLYYDQRGRGKSAGGVRPAEVSIASEVADLERLREHFQWETVAVLGHSWGGLLALEYALRHPARVSHLLLLNTAPASHDDYLLLRQSRRASAADDVARLQALAATARYQEGDLAADAEYYRVHFRTTLRRPEQLEQVVTRLRTHFTAEGIRTARAIEARLMSETWLSSDYDVLPRLRGLSTPALVLHGEYDLIPVECAAHIAQALPAARFVLLKDCGHFAYLECPGDVRDAVIDFMRGASALP